MDNCMGKKGKKTEIKDYVIDNNLLPKPLKIKRGLELEMLFASLGLTTYFTGQLLSTTINSASSLPLGIGAGVMACATIAMLAELGKTSHGFKDIWQDIEKDAQNVEKDYDKFNKLQQNINKTAATYEEGAKIGQKFAQKYRDNPIIYGAKGILGAASGISAGSTLIKAIQGENISVGAIIGATCSALLLTSLLYTFAQDAQRGKKEASGINLGKNLIKGVANKIEKAIT